ncbi:DUF2312 domain-containing protein [Roseomonas sp. HJA6]|uniref:DUF2312 domain-containing protein n=1 Tax=Roseomonas alba TaxID=2846776 RepID=A0ABS7ACH3_9PROT|nr:DUF2312 domain-containing protein [Neoroseomonas alba]
MTQDSEPGGIAAARLQSLIQRIERLEEEKRALQEDIKEIYAEAKSAGFDPKVMRAMIKERRMAEADRQEWQALCDVYRAALGMLDGTPLGEAARKRFMPDPPRPPGDEQAETAASDAPPEAPAAPTAEELLSARAQGAAAAAAGRKVTENPFAAGDARRAAWDEGWCGAAGSDGMDIPPAFRRTTPKKGKPNGKGAGA